jgi:hypothetical protein
MAYLGGPRDNNRLATDTCCASFNSLSLNGLMYCDPSDAIVSVIVPIEFFVLVPPLSFNCMHLLIIVPINSAGQLKEVTVRATHFRSDA